MGLNPISPRLRPVGRRLRLDSKQTAKIQVHVPPGDVLEVSDDVAAQLVAGSPHFKDADAASEDVPSGSAKHVLAWVGDDPERARRALAAEDARKKPRKSVVAALRVDAPQ